MNLIPIGRFSEMTRLSIKALRIYDENGVLPAAEVDSSSGYRYYSLGQANRAEAVRILRSLEVPLEEIRELLDSDDPETVHKQLIIHRELLADRMATQERALAYLQALIERKEGIMPYDVQIIEVAPQQVAAIRFHTSLSRIGNDIASGFGSLVRDLGAEGTAPSGAPFIVYHDVIDEETDGDVEICIPIAADFTGGTDTYGRTLEGETMATAVHHGPYQEIAPAYHTLTSWVSEHGHELSGPPREVYVNDPQAVAPEELLTRVEFPINIETN